MHYSVSATIPPSLSCPVSASLLVNLVLFDIIKVPGVQNQVAYISNQEKKKKLIHEAEQDHFCWWAGCQNYGTNHYSHAQLWKSEIKLLGWIWTWGWWLDYNTASLLWTPAAMIHISIKGTEVETRRDTFNFAFTDLKNFHCEMLRIIFALSSPTYVCIFRQNS